MSIKIRPLKDFLLILPEKEEHSGLVLPNEKKTDRGTVVAVGPGWPTCKKCIGKDTLYMDVKIGDKVLFKPESPDLVEHEGREHYLLRVGYILAILTD